MDDKKIRKGKCRNYGECDRAGEVFEIEAGQPFECPECHQELVDMDGPKKGGKKKPSKISPIVYICGGVAVAAAVGLGCWLALRSPAEPPVEFAQIPDTPAVVEETVAVADTSSSKLPEVEEPVKEKPAPAAPAKVNKLSYGSWTGGWKNGKPHGSGTLTYSVATTIDSRDSKGRIAQPGEYVVGEWDNGHLVQGRWFKNDGSKEAVIIGKAG